MKEVKAEAKLVNHTSNPEETVVRSAWLCYHEDTSAVDSFVNDGEKMSKFIKTLSRAGHTSTFEHVIFTFEITGISRACSHQLVRHRIASYSQQSQRYVKADNPSFIVPETIAKSITYEKYTKSIESIMELYEEMIEDGVPAEDARMILPNAMETKIIVTMNARALGNLFKERLCKRAQWEIQEIAWQMYEQCVKVAPSLFIGFGPDCITSACHQGSMSCGFPYDKEMWFVTK